MASVSCHRLNKARYRCVYSSCEKLAHSWEKLAIHLDIDRDDAQTIQSGSNGAEERLMKVLDKWFEFPKSKPRSWKVLCEALLHIDRARSENISSQHECGCTVCKGTFGTEVDKPVVIVSRLYEEIYESLNISDVILVTKEMLEEGAFTTNDVQKIEGSKDNEVEMLITLLESIVRSKPYNLKIFGTALENRDDTQSIGQRILSEYAATNLPKHPNMKEFVVDVKYKKEFNSMRVKLGKLCITTTELLKKTEKDLENIQFDIGVACPEFKNNLKQCKSLEDVIEDVIRPKLSIIQIDDLRMVYELFDLPMDSIEAYENVVSNFCKKMKLEHAYGQMLMDELKRHVSITESIIFVLNWSGEKENLNDLKDLFKNIVQEHQKDVKVMVVYQGNSVVVECYVHCDKLPSVLAVIRKNEKFLKPAGMMRIKTQRRVVFTAEEMHSLLPTPKLMTKSVEVKQTSGKRRFIEFELPSVIKHIAHTLERYPDGAQILKELIQNADDAEATEVKFILDSSHYPTDHLIHPNLSGFQGPALYAWNNAVFKEEDWKNFGKIEDSSKTANAQKIGKFGIGFISVFHVTDLPIVLSADTAVIIDPHAKFTGTGRGGWTNTIDTFLGYCSHEACVDAVCTAADVDSFRIQPDGAKYYSGTLFRFPLRMADAQSEISDKAYPVERVRNFLFQSFMEEADRMLLFLKHVEKISIYESNTLLYRVSIHPSHKKVVNSERNALIQLETFVPTKPSLSLYSMTVCVECEGQATNMYHWLILNMIGLLDLEKLSNALQFVPWVGVATALPEMIKLPNISLSDVDIHDLSKFLLSIQHQCAVHSTVQTCTKGHAFCFLPLPKQIHLPVHIHGCFALNDSRQSIEWPSRDSKSDGGVWNRELLLKLIAPLYSTLIGCRSKLISYTGMPLSFPAKNEDVWDAYAAWPIMADVKNEEIWRELVKPTIHGLSDHAVFWSINNKWVTKNEAIFLPPPSDDFPYEDAVKVLIKAKMEQIVILPTEIWQTLKKCQLLQYVCSTKVSPTHVREAFKAVNIRFHSFEKFHHLLRYLLQDIHVAQSKKTVAELLGLKIIPLAKEKFTLQPIVSSDEAHDFVYLLPEDMIDAVFLLPGLEDLLINASMIKYPDIYSIFHNLAMSKHFQIRLLDHDTFCQKLLLQSIKTWSKCKRNQSVVWDMNTPSSPTFEWIKKLWIWLGKHENIILKTVGVPILPKEIIDEHTLSCTLLPMPSSSNRYYLKTDEQLASLLEKLGATVIAQNHFVFYHGKLSGHILNPTVFNILDYLKKSGVEKVNSLDNTDKESLLSAIAYCCCKNEKHTQPFILELPIFPVGITITPVKFLSIKSTAEIILPPLSMQFNEALEYPFNILRIKNTDVFRLLSELLKFPVTQVDDMYISILKFASGQMKNSSSLCNGDHLITWIMKESPNLSKKIVNFLSSQNFVRTEANPKMLKKPNELYCLNSENKIFLMFFDPNIDEVFPLSYYKDEHVLDILIKCGLKTWPSLTSDAQSFSEFLQDRAKNVKKKSKIDFSPGSHILEIIGNYPKFSIKLISAVRSVQFLMAQDCRPQNFPNSLPWYGETLKHKLVAPDSLCYDESVANIVGCVLPIIHYEHKHHLHEMSIQLPDKVTQKFLAPKVDDVLKQLQVLIQNVPQQDNTNDVSDIVKEIYQYLDKHASSLTATSLPKRWIWWHDMQGKYSFMPSRQFMLDSQIDLTPFVYCIKENDILLKCEKLVNISGIKSFPTNEELVNVLRKIPVPLTNRHIKMSISILNHLQQHRYKSTGNLLIPTVDAQLRPVDECTYDDREWEKFDLAKFHSISFVHGDVSANLAKYFGVKPLSIQVAPSTKLELRYHQIGQKESLTQRLKGVVDDYCGKIDVFKELIQNADDAKASKVKFLIDWRFHGQQSLFNSEMKWWQGPALVAYNDSVFSDQDFANICNLAGESKMSDPHTIGRYGLGFCACYALTDVPSFISRCFLTIFDPHTRFLGERVSKANRGMQVNLFSEKDGISIYKDQLAPYDDLFGFSLNALDETGFNGTIFRFPLRMRGHSKSDISNEQYDEKRIKKKLKELQNEASKLLIFLKHVQSLEFFEQKKDAKTMEILFKVTKESHDTNRIDLINQSPIFNQESKCSQCMIYTEGPMIKSIQKKSYLIASAIVDSKNCSERIPLAEIAVQMIDNTPVLHNEVGQFFCFLPLPIKYPSPFYINGYFEVGKDRQNLRELQNTEENWNKHIVNNVLPVAFESLLEMMTKVIDQPSKGVFLENYYSLWPSQITKITSLVDSLESSLWFMLKQTKKSLLWSEANGGMWMPLDRACLFVDNLDSLIPSNIKSSAIDVLISIGYHLVKCPEHVIKIITDPKTFDYPLFLKEFFTHIQSTDSAAQSTHLNFLLHVIDEHKLSHVFGSKSDFEVLNCILSFLKQGMENKPLTDDVMKFVVHITQHMYMVKSTKSLFTTFLPDSERILCQAFTLCCDSAWKAPTLERTSMHFVNKLIPHEVAIYLGARSIQDKMLKGNEDNNFLKKTIFGQHSNLINQLNNILQEFPLPPPYESIFKEFIKLADNINAGEIVFVLDNQKNYPSQSLLSESNEWKSLQKVPALCIFNSKHFNKDDIENLCTLANGEEGEPSCTTGQFNVAYHLTDCPTFVSFDETGSPTEFCVFDPLQKYCPKPGSNVPGRRWFSGGAANSLAQFGDQFQPFLLDRLDEMKKLASCFNQLNNGCTVFRLPLTHYIPPKESGAKCLKGAKINQYQVKQCIDNFKHTSENALLFLRHLTSVSIFEIEEDGNAIHHLSLTSTKQKVSKQSLGTGDTFKVELQLHVHTSFVQAQSSWLVNEYEVPLSSCSFKPMQNKAKKRDLNARGGTAFKLECTSSSSKGVLFCMLPINIDSTVPAHMNADFLLNFSHGRLMTIPGLEKWNRLIFEHILIPSYVELLNQAQEYVVQSEESREWYYSLFPRVKASAQSLPVCMFNLFYRTLVGKDCIVLLDARSIDRKKNNWLQISKGVFYDDSHYSADKDPLYHTLCSIGMPITCAPRFIYENICQISSDYCDRKQGLVTPQKVCSYLKSIKKLSTEQSSIIIDQCEHLLQFCLQGREQDTLAGVPLLLTKKNTIDRSGSLFESAFAPLLPPSQQEKFVHPKLEESAIGHRLKQVKAIVALPIEFIAQHILLQDSNKPVMLDSKEIHLVKTLWSFLENSKESNILKFVRLFSKKPIIPSSSGLFYPIYMSKQVFAINQDRGLIEKLCYPTINTSCLDCTNIPVVIASLLSDTTTNPQDIITCMQMAPPMKQVVRFSPKEANRLLYLLNECSEIPSNISELLKHLSLFQTVDGAYHCLSEAKHFCIIGDEIPSNGLKKIQTATQTLILTTARTASLNEKLFSKFDCPTPVKFYTQVVLPNLELFTDDELFDHLTFIKNMIFGPKKVNSSVVDKMMAIIKPKKFITKDGQRYCASELYDPEVQFHAEFHKTKLPPCDWTDGDWLAFLRRLGLQIKVTTDHWLAGATQVAEEGSSIPSTQTVQNITKNKSEILLKTFKELVSTEMKVKDGESLSIEFQDFLKSVAVIPFIYNRNGNHLVKQLQIITGTITPVENISKSFICFKDSVINQKGKGVPLLCQNVLPQSCEFILDFPDTVQCYLLVETPSEDLMVKNLIALSNHLCRTDVQAYVLSSEKKIAIEEIKKAFEDYYEFLNGVSIKTKLHKDLLAARCIFICPNNYSLQLVQPSQVVFHIPNDTDLKPFCYRIPHSLRKYEKLWHALNVKAEVDSLVCLQILSDIKAEMEKQSCKQFNENDPFWIVCKRAYRTLIILLRNDPNAKFCEKIVLPSEDYSLVENTQLVFNDAPQIKRMLEKQENFDYKFLLPPILQPEQKGEMTPPRALNVKLISDITSEELHPDVFDRLNRCKDQELFELKRRKHNCEITEIAAVVLKSNEFRHGLTRLYWHEHKQDPSSDEMFQQKLKEIKDTVVQCMTTIKTVITFKGKTIEGTENSNYQCYLSKHKGKLQLLLLHNQYPVFHFWGQLANSVINHFDKVITAGTPLAYILSCRNPKDIPSLLNELDISEFDLSKKIPTSMGDMDVGMEIPFDEVIKQTSEDLLIFCDYKEEEKVLYHHIFNTKPICQVAQIFKCPLQNGIHFKDDYVQIYVEKGIEDPVIINVSLLQICKILNTSQRQTLLHNKPSTRFCEPVVLANLPEDQSELCHWISQTFRYNDSHFCCSQPQLAKRILSHAYYSLVRLKGQKDVFLEIAEHVLNCVKHSQKDSNIVIKFVRGLKNLSFDGSSVFANPPESTDKLPPATFTLQPTTPPKQSFFQFHYESHYYPYHPPMLYERDPEHQPMQLGKKISTTLAKYKVVLKSGSKPQPNQFAAKAWLQQAKADYMAAIDTLTQLTTDERAGGEVSKYFLKETFLKTGSLEGVIKLMSDSKYPALVCLLCHDALEKFIKGVMYSRMGVSSHLLNSRNLSTLLDEVENYKILPKELLDVIKSCVSSVSIHGNKSRYPSYHYPPFSPAALYSQMEAADCLENVKRMIDSLSQEEDIGELLGDLEEIEYDSFKTALLKSISTGKKEFPEFWIQHEAADGNFRLVLLDDIGDDVEEYNFVASTIEATLPHYTIERIERIQNKLLWDRYYDCARRMNEYNGGVINEMSLFHGSKETDPQNIYQGDAGFDMKFSKKGLWGKGNYFAVNASFSDGYAHECSSDRWQMLMANVLTGYHYNSPPDNNLTKPPVRDTSGGITRRYDCVSGATGGSKIFITYENDQAYPAYLITYIKST